MTSTVRHAGRNLELVEGVVTANLGDLPLGGAPGVVWGLDSEQLNANLVSLDVDGCIGSHVNDEVDQLIVVQVGTGVITVDGEEHRVAADSLVLIPRGAVREIRSDRRLSYLSIHVRRGRLTPQGR